MGGKERKGNRMTEYERWALSDAWLGLRQNRPLPLNLPPPPPSTPLLARQCSFRWVIDLICNFFNRWHAKRSYLLCLTVRLTIIILPTHKISKFCLYYCHVILCLNSWINWTRIVSNQLILMSATQTIEYRAV